MLNKPPAGWTGATGYVSKDLLASTMPAPSDDNLIMVCGPPGMVRPPALAGCGRGCTLVRLTTLFLRGDGNGRC